MKKRFAALALAVWMSLCCLSGAALAAPSGGTGVTRYTVLVLDTSNTARFLQSGVEIYTAGTAIEYVKNASSRFLTNISNARGTNYVAVVAYRDTASVVSGFSDDYGGLKDQISGLTASSTTRSIAAGLSVADSLLSAIPDERAIKNVVLFTTGMTNIGDYSYSGYFDSRTVGSSWHNIDTGVYLYAYANVAYTQAEALKNKGVSLYTIGLFQTMEDMPAAGKDIAQFFQVTAAALASGNEYFYPVEDTNNLEFTFGEVADDIISPRKQITFTYQSGSDYTATCYFKNDYFAGSSYVYNPSLATMSLGFAMSAFGSAEGGSDDYRNKDKNARQLLLDIGVPEEKIDSNDWFSVKPATDSIGVVSGNMPITIDDEDYTLIALAVRGGGYEREWAGNFTIGLSGQHQGFNTAKNQVINYLKSYVAEQEITGPVKIWITGYSRAAATANLVAGALDDGTLISSAITYSPQDIFTYCFETPAGALTAQVKDRQVYNNIFNIINSSDPVPYVAPAALGFGRYGVDRYLPSAESSSNYASQRAKMLAIYGALSSTKSYVVDNFQMKKLEVRNWLPGGERISFVQDDLNNNYSQGLFLSNYITFLARDFIGSRSTYVSAYQDEVREICSVAFGCTDAQLEILISSFASQAKENWGDVAWSYVWNVGVNPWGTEDDAFQIISDWLQNAIKAAGITDYDRTAIDSAGKNLADLLLALAVNHPNYLTTAIMNADCLGAAHYPELCFAWLASMDGNYTPGAAVEFNNGGYRIIRINCEVDVEVSDETGTVAVIINDIPEEVEGSAYLYGMDEDGQKYVVLPVDAEYTVRITGREDGTVNLGISEYSALAGGYVRNVNYFDIDLKAGEQLTGIIPAYREDEIESSAPDGSEAAYTLLDPVGKIIGMSSDLSGTEAGGLYCAVEVLSSDPDHGVVTGSGLRQYGQFALLEAYPTDDNYLFDGWYDKNNTCLSREASYRFCVTDNITITGVFRCSHPNTKIQDAEEASCTKTGYTGDTVCTECGQIVSSGSAVPAPGHSYVNGKCSVCGAIELRFFLKAALYVCVVTLCVIVVGVVIGLLVVRAVRKSKHSKGS